MSTIKVTNLRHESATSNNISLDSSARVGIGTSSPNRQLVVNGGTSEGVIQITNDTSGTAVANGFELIHFTNGETQLLNRENGAMRFDTNGSERMRILAAGGLTFNGDTAAANALDDYEEGTFTPTISGGYTSVTYNSQHGWYTKVGRLVVASARILFSGTSNTSHVIMGGLPFTAGNIGGGAYGGGGIPYSTLSVITNTSPYVGGSTTTVKFYVMGTGATVNSSGNASSNWISYVVSYSV